jgi:hypothetical protein
MTERHLLNLDDVSVLVARELREAFECDVVPGMVLNFLKATIEKCGEEPRVFQILYEAVAAEKARIQAEDTAT